MELLAPEEWHRAGRGLGTDIPNLRGLLLQRAIDGLHPEWAPYHLLGVSKVRTKEGYLDEVRRLEAQSMDDWAGKEIISFLWSPELTPGLQSWLAASSRDLRATPLLAVNGLIAINYRWVFRGVEEPTSVGCVNRVATYQGQVIEHVEYVKVYRQLVRRLKSLVA